MLPEPYLDTPNSIFVSCDDVEPPVMIRLVRARDEELGRNFYGVIVALGRGVKAKVNRTQNMNLQAAVDLFVEHYRERIADPLTAEGA